VGAHDGDHPSGLPGSDANEALVDWPASGGLSEPGCAWRKDTPPLGDFLAKVDRGCRAKRGI
jgi:hypothetical protein